MMQTRIQSLLTAMDRVRMKVSEPYQKILIQTTKLRRLQVELGYLFCASSVAWFVNKKVL